ncbi:D-amino acid aminotransferase [Candidatus Nitrosacidococcus sp. I8]|uniref:D-amino acid aminotransferase n=1 Tax=Candidatus Nitrosacidococcus sp. I8 TaxID=2942908 RepID=UPI0022268A47|nr:D-amino acid aminotransferase [Candidatus Nitrosacidococcus sp. I8]CAH9019420.1 D-alanine aminotransferase [Candidatus Nitrosacidococcus sp. I8]
MPIVYLNGAFLPLTEAKVSVLDRGFLLADGIYEVIPAYGKHFFRLHAHLDRLEHSLQGIHLENPMSLDQWQSILQQLILQNEGLDQAVYLQITRGVAPRDHAFPKDIQPTVFAMSNPIKSVPEHWLQKGISTITLEDIRWQWCHIKSIALLANVLLRQEAVATGMQEAILLKDDQVTEGAASNVFIVTDEQLRTPPVSSELLSGITRDLVLELAREANISCEEAKISTHDLHHADEIWLTSSTREILPVTTLNGAPVGTGKPGIKWQQLNHHYQAYKEKIRLGMYQS